MYDLGNVNGVSIIIAIAVLTVVLVVMKYLYTKRAFNNDMGLDIEAMQLLHDESWRKHGTFKRCNKVKRNEPRFFPVLEESMQWWNEWQQAKMLDELNRENKKKLLHCKNAIEISVPVQTAILC